MYRNSNKVYVVDNDHTNPSTLMANLVLAGYDVEHFFDVDSLISVAQTAIPVCILFDLEIPGASGIDLVHRLKALAYPAPVMMMSEERSISVAISLIREGAYDFLEKPFSGTELIQRIERAKLLFFRKGSYPPQGNDQLTEREQEVLKHWVAGSTSKEIARILGISPRTIDIHRSKIMRKLHAKNSAEIVSIAISGRLGFGPPPNNGK
jgi:FixJ family two-component response regulator